MFNRVCWILLLAAAMVACDKKPALPPASVAPTVSSVATQQVFQVRGVIVGLTAGSKTVRIRHEEIPDYMPAMTMPFDVRNTNELAGLAAGDTVTFQMNVTETDGWIERIQKQTAVATNANILPPNAPMRIVREVKPLSVGDLLPEYQFTNQLGRAVSLSALRGNALAITFVFTRCPFPTFCPLMSNNFKAVHELLEKIPHSPTNWHLLEITIDPEFDTPERLNAYAGRFRSNDARWSFLTGSLMDATAFGEQFGLQFIREPGGSISHNLRTVVVDAAGKVQAIIPENKWTPDELTQEIIKAAAVK